MRHRLAKHSHVIDKHFSMLPSPELRRRNIDRYHKMFSLRENFSRKKIAKWACDNIASNMYVDRPYRALAVYCAHSTMDTHCTAAHSTMDTHCTAVQLKGNPRWKKNTEFCKFLQAMPKPGKVMGSHTI